MPNSSRSEPTPRTQSITVTRDGKKTTTEITGDKPPLAPKSKTHRLRQLVRRSSRRSLKSEGKYQPSLEPLVEASNEALDGEISLMLGDHASTYDDPALPPVMSHRPDTPDTTETEPSSTSQRESSAHLPSITLTLVEDGHQADEPQARVVRSPIARQQILDPSLAQTDPTKHANALRELKEKYKKVKKQLKKEKQDHNKTQKALLKAQQEIEALKKTNQDLLNQIKGERERGDYYCVEYSTYLGRVVELEQKLEQFDRKLDKLDRTSSFHRAVGVYAPQRRAAVPPTSEDIARRRASSERESELRSLKAKFQAMDLEHHASSDPRPRSSAETKDRLSFEEREKMLESFEAQVSALEEKRGWGKVKSSRYTPGYSQGTRDLSRHMGSTRKRNTSVVSADPALRDPKYQPTPPQRTASRLKHLARRRG